MIRLGHSKEPGYVATCAKCNQTYTGITLKEATDAARDCTHHESAPPHRGITILEIESAVERVLHRNGLVNGHPLSANERQAIAIRTVVVSGGKAVTVLLANGHDLIAQELEQVLDQLRKEFKL